jgi:succinyl-diaminopimelate desuccinylase
MFPPHHVPADSPFVQTLLRAYERYTGKKGECLYDGGGTYVHNLKNGVAFGGVMPGTENNMHGADEFMVIEELLSSVKIYAQVIIDICS